MKIVSIVTAPFIWLLTQSTEFLLDILRKTTADGRVTEEEIKATAKEEQKVVKTRDRARYCRARFHIGDRKNKL
jgi:putative hemolysin